MVGDAGEDVGEPGLGIDVAEATGLDQRVRDRRPLATAIGAAEQPRFAPERYAAQRPFCGVVREANRSHPVRALPDGYGKPCRR